MTIQNVARLLVQEYGGHLSYRKAVGILRAMRRMCHITGSYFSPEWYRLQDYLRYDKSDALTRTKRKKRGTR